MPIGRRLIRTHISLPAWETWMALDYSVETVNKLSERFADAELHRSMRVERYEPGDELSYDVTGVAPAIGGKVKLRVEKFIGGGFAGQVYRVKVLDIDSPKGEIAGLAVGGEYAIKILIPPSSGSRKFRDLIYKIGFQAPFSLQVNPSAARAGALWQKFIRRAAGEHFGDDRCVVDILATFVDSKLGSCGEISEWVEGRTWRFEVDDNLFARKKWKPGESIEGMGAPEFMAKREFMAKFVELLHELGAPEFARQYEWWTCKSQPNALKRLDTEDRPTAGLTAVDFRAGLALLAFVPMSPGDVKLIFSGLRRGALVQFDRGNLDKLRAYIDAHGELFADMGPAFQELVKSERRYRHSQLDITHNHVHLLYSGGLWSQIFDGAVGSWRIRNIADEHTGSTLWRSKTLTMLFGLVGAIPSLGMIAAIVIFALGLAAAIPSEPAVEVIEEVLSAPPEPPTDSGEETYQPLLYWGTLFCAIGWAALVAVGSSLVGRLLIRLWGRADHRKHYGAMLTNLGYFKRALSARMCEKLIGWLRDRRVSDATAEKIATANWRVLPHLPLSILPASLHRILSDRAFAAEKLGYIFVRPIRLLVSAEAREQWLREMVAEGQRKHMLTDEDAEAILSRIKDNFIQKYLKSLAVHVCTLPVTQIVSIAVAWIYVWTHPELTSAEATAAAGAILIGFQLVPLSPGSLCRGLYVVYLVIRERNFKDYNIAVFLGFFKYVGYLAFPIQMANHYPALARFMAAHWATGAVRILPVFGEHGALLEHAVFDRFYNYPLSVRKRMGRRAEHRATFEPRKWHAIAAVLVAAVAFGAVEALCRSKWGVLPTLGNLWAMVMILPALVGSLVTIYARGMPFVPRIKLTIVSGVFTAILCALVHACLMFVPALGGTIGESGQVISELWTRAGWGVFLFTLIATVAGLLTEINLGEPKLRSQA